MGQETITKNSDITERKQNKMRGAPPEFLFKKGESGNPAGRPPGSVSITTAIKIKLLELTKDQKRTYLDVLIERILTKAIADVDPQIIKQIWSYLDGPPGENPASLVNINLLNKNSIEAREEGSERILT